MVKEKVESSCPCWNCMAKSHVKKDLSVTLVLKPIKVKTLFLDLQKDKETNKNKVNTTSKGQ